MNQVIAVIHRDWVWVDRNDGCVVCGEDVEEGSVLFCSDEHAIRWSRLVSEHLKICNVEFAFRPYNVIVLCNN